MRQRWPYSVFGTGTEPDPRFSLANERTSLAWMRTGMSLVGAGLALAVFAGETPAGALVKATAVFAALAGATISVWSVARWVAVERALRRQQPLPAPSALMVLPLALIPFALIIVLYALEVVRA